MENIRTYSQAVTLAAPLTGDTALVVEPASNKSSSISLQITLGMML